MLINRPIQSVHYKSGGCLGEEKFWNSVWHKKHSYIFFLLFWFLIFSLYEKERQGREEGGRKRGPIQWFTLQRPSMAVAGPEPETRNRNQGSHMNGKNVELESSLLVQGLHYLEAGVMRQNQGLNPEDVECSILISRIHAYSPSLICGNMESTQ